MSVSSLSRDPSVAGAAIDLLANITVDFATSLDIEETLQQAIDQVINYLQAEAASIFLLDDSAQTLVCRKCAGPVDITGLRLPVSQGIVGAAVTTNSVQLVRDAQENAQFASAVDAGTGFVTRSILCVPIAVKDRSIGALELINKRGGDGLFAPADRHLATAVAAAAALAIHNARMAEVLVEQERVRKELELARDIQLSLLPPADDALPIYGLNLPARQVSGDFFDFFMRADGQIYFSIADVAGKGMNAALLMAKSTSLLRCLAKSIDDPAALLRQVNAEIFETASMGLFVTIVAGFIEPRTRVMRYANAGHPPPLLHRVGSGFEQAPATAPPLGIMSTLEVTTQYISLAEGTVYLFTDGVTEASDPQGSALGLTGLMAIIDTVTRVAPAQRLAAIVATMEAQSRMVDDDLTLLLVELDGH